MRSFLLAVFAIVVLVGCSDDPTTPADTNTSSTNSFNVTGNGYSNAAFKGYNADSASSAVESGGGAVIAFTGKGTKTNEVFGISLMVNEAKTGKFAITPGGDVSLVLITSDGSSVSTYVAVGGEIDVKTWEGVGGAAKGTFSGSAVLSGPSPVTITISDGKFDTKRK